MGLIEILAIFIAFSIAVTYLFKKFFNTESFVVASLIRTKRPIQFFDRMARHSHILDVFALAGTVLGFGTFAVDYIYGRKLSREKRILLFVLSFTGLSALLVGIDAILGNPFSKNFMIGPAYPLLVASFGLMGFAG